MQTATLVLSALAVLGVATQILLQLRRWHVEDRRRMESEQTAFSVRLVRYGKRRERWQLAVRNDGREPFQLNGAALRPSGRRIFWLDGNAECGIVRVVEKGTIERFAPISVERTANKDRAKNDSELRLWTADGVFEVPLSDARKQYAAARRVGAERPAVAVQQTVEQTVAAVKPSTDDKSAVASPPPPLGDERSDRAGEG